MTARADFQNGALAIGLALLRHAIRVARNPPFILAAAFGCIELALAYFSTGDPGGNGLLNMISFRRIVARALSSSSAIA